MQTNDTITVMDLTKAIEPKRIYTASDLVTGAYLPWARNIRTVKKLVDNDMAGENILNATIDGEGRQRRYQIEGKNIIKYIKKYGPALIGTVRKPKQ
jgi:hypothetical protein